MLFYSGLNCSLSAGVSLFWKPSIYLFIQCLLNDYYNPGMGLTLANKTEQNRLDLSVYITSRLLEEKDNWAADSCNRVGCYKKNLKSNRGPQTQSTELSAGWEGIPLVTCTTQLPLWGAAAGMGFTTSVHLPLDNPIFSRLMASELPVSSTSFLMLGDLL